MKTTPKLPKSYQNNPFYIATNGLELLFNKAQSVGVALAVLSGIGLLGSIPNYFFSDGSQPSQQNTDQAASSIGSIPPEAIIGISLIVLVIVLFFCFVGIVIKGVSDFAAAQLAAGKTVTLSESFRGVFNHFWSYTWMQIIVGVKTFLWTLLFIIPGFVMSYRYSLAGVSFFDKKLRGNAASKHSADITKGAWLTTFASQTLLNLITFGIIQPLLAPGTEAVLYRQLVKAKSPKPKAHTLSWLTLILPLVLIIVLGAGIALLIWAVVNYMNVSP